MSPLNPAVLLDESRPGSRARRSTLFLLLAGAALFGTTAAHAGAPYATDDPEPVELHKWEIFAFTTAEHSPGATEGEAGVEINYGVGNGLQLSVLVPVAFSAAPETAIGRGDFEIALKYRVMRADEHGARPSIAFVPTLGVPTGSKQFTAGKPTFFLPLWAEKEFGGWRVFGGGGMAFNPGYELRNQWFAGAAATRDITDKLNLGVELYHETSEERAKPAATRVAVGASYQFHPNWSVLASVGRGLHRTRETGRHTLFLALQFAD